MIEQLLNYDAKNIAELVNFSKSEKIAIVDKIDSGVDFIINNISDFTFIEGEADSPNYGKTGIHTGKVCRYLMSLADTEEEKIIVIATLRVSLVNIIEDSEDPMTSFLKSFNKQ